MDRLDQWLKRGAALGFGALILAAPGCRNGNVRVPPVPRYSNEAPMAPGPGAEIDQMAQPDPYGGLNPYANANTGNAPSSFAEPSNSAAPYSDPPAASNDPYAGMNATTPDFGAPPAGFPGAAPANDPYAQPAGVGDAPASLPVTPSPTIPTLPQTGPLP